MGAPALGPLPRRGGGALNRKIMKKVGEREEYGKNEVKKIKKTKKKRSTSRL